MNTGSAQERLLSEQRAYYSALAPDYLDQLIDLPGGADLNEALDAFRPAGSVLELACGPGSWPPQLLRHASDVTAVDASPEMLATGLGSLDHDRSQIMTAAAVTVPGQTCADATPVIGAVVIRERV